MPDVNKAIVMGVLRRDHETKNFSNGGSITSFSIATTDHWKKKLQANANRLQNGTESLPATV